MGQILTASDVMMCPHGGQVSISALQATVSAGALVVRPGDVFTIAGCAMNVSGAPHPCVIVEWQSPSTRVKAGDRGSAAFVLTTASVGVCKAADQAPQGTVIVQPAQTKARAQ
jgi:hypothetical protein